MILLSRVKMLRLGGFLTCAVFEREAARSTNVVLCLCVVDGLSQQHTVWIHKAQELWDGLLSSTVESTRLMTSTKNWSA